MTKETLILNGKRALWGLLGSTLITAIAFATQNLDLIVQLFNLSAPLQAAIISIATALLLQLTKIVNGAFSIEEKVGRAVRKLAGKA